MDIIIMSSQTQSIIQVDTETSKQDYGYLEKLVPHLFVGKPISNKNEMRDLVSEFAALHSRMMLYQSCEYPNYRKEERLWPFKFNSVYENVRFLPWSNRLAGNVHSTTGDINIINGDLNYCMYLDTIEEMRPVIINRRRGINKYEDLKGLIYVVNPDSYHGKQLTMIIGNEFERHDIPKMPEFSRGNAVTQEY